MSLDFSEVIKTINEIEKEYHKKQSGKKFMHDSSFYRWQRNRLDILTPIGSKYKLSYDGENRVAFPNGQKEVFNPKNQTGEYISEAKKYGANVIIRPDKLSGDETSTDEVIVHALDVLDLENSDILVLLQTTSPLISTKSINACIIKLINNENLASVITVRESHPFMWSPDQNDIWSPKNHDRKKRLRRQEMSEEGWETGGCYAIRVKDAKMQGIRYPSPSSVVKINHLESLDIDTIEDLNSINELKK
jgi:N-acylneuraminate cytidylyltransferase